MSNYLKADLHLHSCYSDGEYSPQKLIDICAAKKLDVVSLTDHDTVDGVSQMINFAREKNIRCITGIELSTILNSEIHILGYNFNTDNAEFITELKNIKNLRIQRINNIIERLNKINIKLTKEEVLTEAKDSASPGRVHIAKALVKKGVAGTVAAAFSSLLAAGKPAYAPSHRIQTQSAIKLIKNAGGKAVLAHPFSIDISFTKLLPLICRLAELGLDGIETMYYTHNSLETSFLKQAAKKLNLISTCGSDYHGSIRNSSVTPYNLASEDYKRLF